MTYVVYVFGTSDSPKIFGSLNVSPRCTKMTFEKFMKIE